MRSYYIGLGFDLHKFTKKRKNLVIGGVPIKYYLGFKAVSDGDVVLHAICDGILGAASLGDIGDYFSPYDKRWKGVDSRVIVEAILKKINKKYKIGNIDITIIAEKPPLAKYKSKITNSLKRLFGTKDINVKIKSKEKMDILGGINSIACLAVVLLKKC